MLVFIFYLLKEAGGQNNLLVIYMMPVVIMTIKSAQDNKVAGDRLPAMHFNKEMWGWLIIKKYTNLY